MQILINGNPVTIPSSLAEFTLGQRIDFYNEHGRLLDEMAMSIMQMEDGIDKDLEVVEFQFEKMVRTFAFFAGCTPEAIKESEFINDIANIYLSSMAVLFDDEMGDQELQQEFFWKDELWMLQPPVLKHGDKMTFGELIDSKQIVKDMLEVGENRWEYMLPICAIYLRKPGEDYREEFLFDNSERLQLMRDLPMNIALQVGFFLTNSMNTCLNILQSSNLPGLKDPGNIAKVISTVGDG